jgi:hypothetical protein
VRPLSDESASSLAFRLAQGECCTVTDFCRAHFGLSYAAAHCDLDRLLVKAHAQVLAGIAGVTTQTIRRTAIPGKWMTSTWDARLRRHSGSVRVCPLCLEQRRYGRRFWRTIFAAACPVHGVELVSGCPRCSAMFPYFGAPAGLLVQFWLEMWPVCPACVRKVHSIFPAHAPLVAMSKRWCAALSGIPQYGLRASTFLWLSARLIDRFLHAPRYQRVAEMIHASERWPAHAAAALMLRTLLSGHISNSIFYAAIDRDFTPSQLAKDIIN